MLNDDIYKSIKQILVSEGVWTSNLQEMENEIQDISLKWYEMPYMEIHN